jgi:hypothetical protein
MDGSLIMIKKIPLKVLTVDQEGCHLLVEAVISGFKVNLLVDTGATLTVMDINRIRKIFPERKFEAYQKFFMGIGAGNIEPWFTRLEEILFGELIIRNKSVVLIDMSDINKAYAAFDLPRVDGVIGGDILKQHNAVINYKTSTMDMEVTLQN